MTHYITKGIGGFYYVKTETGIVECRARGIFRKRGITPVAGDRPPGSSGGRSQALKPHQYGWLPGSAARLKYDPVLP